MVSDEKSLGSNFNKKINIDTQYLIKQVLTKSFWITTYSLLTLFLLQHLIQALFQQQFAIV